MKSYFKGIAQSLGLCVFTLVVAISINQAYAAIGIMCPVYIEIDPENPDQYVAVCYTPNNFCPAPGGNCDWRDRELPSGQIIKECRCP